MLLALGLETATSRASVALARDGEILSEAPLRERAEHARDLLPCIDSMLRSARLDVRAIGGIGVATGPGSFTGVRVGMATAKGLGYALSIRVMGISTLEAAARAALALRPSATVLCAALQAGRGEVYAALFRVERGGPVRSTPDRSYEPAELARLIPEGSLLVGDGATAVLARATVKGRLGCELLDPLPLLAGAIALGASATIVLGSAYLPGGLAPNYVRPSDAEVTRRRP